MSSFFSSCNQWLAKHMFFVVLAGLLLGFFIPLQDSPLLRQAVIALFAYMTFVTALGTSFRKFVGVLRSPWTALWILILVHGITPFTAWAAGHFFYPDDAYIRMGYLIGASIPIGVTSIIWTSLVKGDLPTSLVAVTLDTFVVPLILPPFFQLVVGQTIAIDYYKMMHDLLLMVTLPSVIGMLLHDWTHGTVTGFAQSFGGATAKLSLFVVIFFNAAVVMPQIVWNAAILKMILVTLCIVASSFLVGYLGSFALKDRSPGMTMTMIYNVGIRNNACGLVLALSYFPPRAAIPITLAILFQQPLATVVAQLKQKLAPSTASST